MVEQDDFSHDYSIKQSWPESFDSRIADSRVDF